MPFPVDPNAPQPEFPLAQRRTKRDLNDEWLALDTDNLDAWVQAAPGS